VPLKMPSDEEQNISSSQISTISTGSTVKWKGGGSYSRIKSFLSMNSLLIIT
jgi:hypothetical protein